jgi:hypothetical protein
VAVCRAMGAGGHTPCGAGPGDFMIWRSAAQVVLAM